MKDNIDFSKALDSGIVRHRELYVEIFKVLPNYYQYYKDDLKMDTNFLTLEKCKEIFGDDIDVKTIRYNRIFNTSRVDVPDMTEWDSSTQSYKIKNYPTVLVINYTESYIIEIDYNSCTIYYNDINPEIIINKIIESVPAQPIISKTATIDLVAFDNGYYTINSKIKRTEIDLNTHYNDDFLPVYDDTIKFLNEQESGLIIFHGEKGSGKTTMLRYLMSHTDKKYLLVTNAVASHMAEPEFISFMMEHKDSIFILEDCEQILMARESNRFGGAIANILNMSDGLMSDIFNIKFICTFNTDIKNVDEALLRPGRCFVKYEFKALSEEKTKNLLHSIGKDVENPGEMTLAQIYNYSESETKDKPKKKIGF